MCLRRVYAIAIFAALSGCASQSSTTSQSPNASPEALASPEKRAAKSADGSSVGEIVGTINPNSKFAKLKIGMDMAEVHSLIKAPDDMKRHETGKRWIPFYFGSDAQRIQTYYAGEGCLTYTGGNVFGGGGSQLIRISVDKTKACFD